MPHNRVCTSSLVNYMGISPQQDKLIPSGANKFLLDLDYISNLKITPSNLISNN